MGRGGGFYSKPSETEPTTNPEVAPTDTTILDSVVTTEVEPTEDITTDLVKENPFRYAGYYFDRKTQYYYLHARYYDPRPARFISEDTYEGEIENPLSLNQYVYVDNNPLNYADPTGHHKEISANQVKYLLNVANDSDRLYKWAKKELLNSVHFYGKFNHNQFHYLFKLALQKKVNDS